MWKLLLLPVLLYLLICAAAALLQERLLFPAWAVRPAGPLPAGAERLRIERPDGVHLHGVYLPPRTGGDTSTLILAFPGNASDAQGLAEHLSAIYPEHGVAAFYYRGYRPSTGAAAAAALIEDAPFVFDLVQARYRPERMIAVGQSLGTGVAAQLATQRSLAGAILITPFDSLTAVARQNYPFLPVTLLFRHEMNSAAALGSSAVPIAILGAEHDTLIRPERTDALRRATRNLTYDYTLPGAAHNDIHLHPTFASVMREALHSFFLPSAEKNIR